MFAQDVTPSYLDALRRRIGREGLNNVSLALGEPHDPRLPEASVDLAHVVAELEAARAAAGKGESPPDGPVPALNEHAVVAHEIRGHMRVGGYDFVKGAEVEEDFGVPPGKVADVLLDRLGSAAGSGAR